MEFWTQNVDFRSKMSPFIFNRCIRYVNFFSEFSVVFGCAFFNDKLAGSQSSYQRKFWIGITLKQLVLMGISDAKSMIRTVNKRIVSPFTVLFRWLTISHYVKWGASSWWSSSLCCPMRKLDEMTIWKTRLTLSKSQPQWTGYKGPKFKDWFWHDSFCMIQYDTVWLGKKQNQLNY